LQFFFDAQPQTYDKEDTGAHRFNSAHKFSQNVDFDPNFIY